MLIISLLVMKIYKVKSSYYVVQVPEMVFHQYYTYPTNIFDYNDQAKEQTYLFW